MPVTVSAILPPMSPQKRIALLSSAGVGAVLLVAGVLWFANRKPQAQPVLAPSPSALPKRNAPTVKTGLDVLIAQNFAPLQGKRIGLIANPTGVASDYRANIDILFRAPGVKLVALYGPEHGVRGDAGAGEAVGNSRDPATGLPVYSLYGKTRKPTAAMLKGVDTLVFDLQDIGSRSYTYISALGLCMEAAAENSIPFVVLDRPNPLGGERIEGNIPLPAFRSYVGRYPVPYTHGLTIGEFAQMLNGEGWMPSNRRSDLTVIKMEGWRREMTWEETGLPWIPTSPHVPHADSALYYAATGITGELSAVNIGVGYTQPFELAGAPGVAPTRLAADLTRLKLPGLVFRPAYWKPFYGARKGQSCGGVQIHFTDKRAAPLTRLNFDIMDAIRRQNPKFAFFPNGQSRMFDLVCGTDQVRRMFLAGKSADAIWKVWNADAEAFRAQRQPYLLYE